MRQINYILIHEADHQIPVRATLRSHDANLGFHYIISNEGIVRNPIDIRQTDSISNQIRNLNSFDRRDYDAHSVGILAQGEEREALIDLLVELRSHFPEAQILGTREIDGKNIHPIETMNQLRRELSDLP